MRRIPFTVAAAALIVTAVAASSTTGDVGPQFHRCRKPPVALRVSHVTCRYARWFFRHQYRPQPPGTVQHARGFTCSNHSLRPRTDPGGGSAGLWVQCVHGPRIFRFHFL